MMYYSPSTKMLLSSVSNTEWSQCQILYYWPIYLCRIHLTYFLQLFVCLCCWSALMINDYFAVNTRGLGTWWLLGPFPAHFSILLSDNLGWFLTLFVYLYFGWYGTSKVTKFQKTNRTRLKMLFSAWPRDFILQ